MTAEQLCRVFFSEGRPTHAERVGMLKKGFVAKAANKAKGKVPYGESKIDAREARNCELIAAEQAKLDPKQSGAKTKYTPEHRQKVVEAARAAVNKRKPGQKIERIKKGVAAAYGVAWKTLEAWLRQR